MKKGSKISVGVIVPGLEVGEWVDRVIRSFQYESDFAVTCAWVSPPIKNFSLPSRIIAHFVNLIDALRGSITRGGTNRPIPVESSIVRHVDSLEAINVSGLDLVVDCVGLATSRIEGSPAFGVWQFLFHRMGEKILETGLEEVLRQLPISSVFLFVWLGHKLGYRELVRLELRTHPTSPTLNRLQLEGAAVSALDIALRGLKAMSKDREKYFATRRLVSSENTTSSLSSGFEILRLSFRDLFRIVANRFSVQRPLDQWTFGMLNSGIRELNEQTLQGVRWSEPGSEGYLTDPFPISAQGRRFVFLEKFVYARRKGHVAVAEIDENNAVAEIFDVLDTDFHLSFPFVFEHEGRYFLLPEQSKTDQIVLYEADEFPRRWRRRRILLDGFPGVDNMLCFHEGTWWLFTTYGANGCQDNNLHLFSSKSLFGDFQAHPKNPVVCDISHSRMAGKFFVEDGVLYRPAQNCGERYGGSVAVMRVTTLTEDDYSEELDRQIYALADSPFPSGLHTVNSLDGLTIISGRRYINSPYAKLLCR